MNIEVDRSKYSRIRDWGNYVLGIRHSVGHAARANRGRYSGNKVHRIVIEEIVEVKDPAAEQALQSPTLGKRFLVSGKPVVFSAYPACGCCQGQMAAREQVGAVVSCFKCL